MQNFIAAATPELVQVLKARSNIRTFYPGEQIFAAEDAALFLPIVVSGSVKMLHFLTPGKEVTIGIFREGEMFAVPPVFDGKEYPATAIAMEETQLLLLHRPEFLALLQESNEFAFAVLGWMSEMLREKTATIRNLAMASPEHRVANVLLKLAEADGENPPIRIGLRREEIARIAGLTTETTIRVVRRLADQDLLRIDRGKIFIDDTERLTRHLRV